MRLKSQLVKPASGVEYIQAIRMRFLSTSAFLFVFTAFPAFTQQPPKQRIPLIGTAERVYTDTLLVKTRAEVVMLYADAKTSVWYGKEYHDFSHINAGDKISADAERLPDGRLRVASMWVNYTNFGAVITSRKGDGFEVLTNFDADTYSGYRKEKKLVLVDADTVFESGSEDDLKSGRVVSVVGLDLKNGKIQATLIDIIPGRTVQDRDWKVLPLTGPQK
jgi:hypothetical protein